MGRVVLADRDDLRVEVDDGSGDILLVEDRTTGQRVIDQPPLWELQVNRHTIPLTLAMHEDRRGILQTISRATHYAGYSHGWALQLARLVVPGRRSLNIQYRLKRIPMAHEYPKPGPNTHDVEMPLWVDTIGLLGWRWSVMKPDTRMRLIHLSGGGPFEHMSVEDGPVAEVTPKLWHYMRRTYPGVQSIPGVAYYRTDPDEWLFITARRSRLAYTNDYTPDGMPFHVQYHRLMDAGAEFPVPEICVFWGRDLGELDAVLDAQFDAYEEPPDWLYHTTWAVMSGSGHTPRTFAQLGDVAEVCVRDGGIGGLWFYTHTIRRSDVDTSPASHGPNPDSGTPKQFKQMVRRIHDMGAKVQVWMSACGMKPWHDMRPAWAMRGVDDKHWVSWGHDEHEFIVACNPLDPGYRKYMLDWVERYVGEYDIDGFFLDCGVFTFPPDFASHGDPDRFPSEAGPAFRELFQEMWDRTQAIKPNDFHLWYEGTHSEYPGTGYCHGAMVFPPPPPEQLTNQRALYGIVNRGKRLVWGTLHAYDLACGYVQWNPAMGGTSSIDDARRCAADPMNRYVIDLVRNRGVRDARGLTDGLSILDDHLVTIPEYHGPVTIVHPDLMGLKAVEHVLTKERLDATPDPQGRPTIDLSGGAAYRIIR